MNLFSNFSWNVLKDAFPNLRAFLTGGVSSISLSNSSNNLINPKTHGLLDKTTSDFFFLLALCCKAFINSTMAWYVLKIKIYSLIQEMLPF